MGTTSERKTAKKIESETATALATTDAVDERPEREDTIEDPTAIDASAPLDDPSTEDSTDESVSPFAPLTSTPEMIEAAALVSQLAKAPNKILKETLTGLQDVCLQYRGKGVETRVNVGESHGDISEDRLIETLNDVEQSFGVQMEAYFAGLKVLIGNLMLTDEGVHVRDAISGCNLHPVDLLVLLIGSTADGTRKKALANVTKK